MTGQSLKIPSIVTLLNKSHSKTDKIFDSVVGKSKLYGDREFNKIIFYTLFLRNISSSYRTYLSLLPFALTGSTIPVCKLLEKFFKCHTMVCLLTESLVT